MKPLFDIRVTPTDPNYSALRDDPRNVKLKEYCQRLWNIYYPYADPQFPEEFTHNLHPRFWELYLGVNLLKLGFRLVPKTSSAGPDIHFILGDRNIWIEAAAPGEGEGPDAVPMLEEHNGFEPLPEDKIILRFTHAILKKKDRFLEYLENGVVGDNDVLIIAINGRGIQMLMFDGPMPAIVRSVYPVGDYAVTFNRESMEVVREGYQTRFVIHKESGAEVSTSAFINPDYSIISGILYSGAALWDLPIESGHEFLFIHNSLANVPIEIGWLGVGRDYYKEGNQLFATNN